MCALCLTLSGCAALFPVTGQPSDEMNRQMRLPNRSPKRTINLSLLRQNPPVEHLVDSGDVLGVYIEGILGNAETTPPVFASNDKFALPSVGYPIRVDADGTISLPMTAPLRVKGLTIAQVRQLVFDAYTRGARPLLQADRPHIHVALQKPRTYRVIVIREESGNAFGNRGAASVVNFEIDKRGTGRVVTLPAYRNDVLNALTETGGLPGLDAETVIYVMRARRNGCGCQPGGNAVSGVVQDPMVIRAQSMQPDYSGKPVSILPDRLRKKAEAMETAPVPGTSPPDVPDDAHGHVSEPLGLDNATGFGHSMLQLAPVPQQQLLPPQQFGQPSNEGCQPQADLIRIPLKIRPGQPVSFSEQDITLQDGDIVLVENRVREFYYTAGLLGGGQLVIPRDYDIGVMDAIALAESDNRRVLSSNAIGGVSVLNQDVTVGASRVILQRRLPSGKVVPIEIDLYEMMKHPEKQIMIQPEDRIILRYTRAEAFFAFFERFFIEGVVTGTANNITPN